MMKFLSCPSEDLQCISGHTESEAYTNTAIRTCFLFIFFFKSLFMFNATEACVVYLCCLVREVL